MKCQNIEVSNLLRSFPMVDFVYSSSNGAIADTIINSALVLPTVFSNVIANKSQELKVYGIFYSDMIHAGIAANKRCENNRCSWANSIWSDHTYSILSSLIFFCGIQDEIIRILRLFEKSRFSEQS